MVARVQLAETAASLSQGGWISESLGSARNEDPAHNPEIAASRKPNLNHERQVWAPERMDVLQSLRESDRLDSMQRQA
jgi:hypothetical protein